jgi:hypothetical protein
MPGGLWEGLAAVTRLSRTGCRVDDLIVRPFNGQLFARRAAPSVEEGRPGRRPSRLTAARDAALSRSLTALATRAPRPVLRRSVMRILASNNWSGLRARPRR